MNSISSMNFTASSILSGNSNLKVAEQNQNVNPELQTQDTLVKSEKEEPELKKGLFKKKVGNPFKKLSDKLTDKEKDAALKGALIGGAVGGIAGGITAYNMSWNEIKATNEVNSITLDWQEPNMVKENLGKIPSNYYSWSPYPSHHAETVNVNRENPVMVDGKPVMHDVTKTYTDYGKPQVTWKDHSIQQKYMDGYDERITEDTHTESQYLYTDSDGNKHYQDYEVVDGYWHSFSPTIGVNNVGSYQTPEVHFETGVNVGLNTTLGVLAGAGIGALAGGIAGAAIQHAMDKNKPEMPTPTPEEPKPPVEDNPKPPTSSPTPPSGGYSDYDEPVVYHPAPKPPPHDIHHPSHYHGGGSVVIHHPSHGGHHHGGSVHHH